MTFRLLMVGALLASSCASYAMDEINNTTIKMPKADVLIERLCGIGLSHFINKTDIVTQLADQEIEPIPMAFLVENCLHDYGQHMQTHSPWTAGITATFMQKRKPLIFEALLEGYPQALNELENYGLCNPTISEQQ